MVLHIGRRRYRVARRLRFAAVACLAAALCVFLGYAFSRVAIPRPAARPESLPPHIVWLSPNLTGN